MLAPTLCAQSKLIDDNGAQQSPNCCCCFFLEMQLSLLELSSISNSIQLCRLGSMANVLYLFQVLKYHRERATCELALTMFLWSYQCKFLISDYTISEPLKLFFKNCNQGRRERWKKNVQGAQKAQGIAASIIITTQRLKIFLNTNFEKFP